MNINLVELINYLEQLSSPWLLIPIYVLMAVTVISILFAKMCESLLSEHSLKMFSYIRKLFPICATNIVKFARHRPPVSVLPKTSEIFWFMFLLIVHIYGILVLFLLSLLSVLHLFNADINSSSNEYGAYLSLLFYGIFVFYFIDNTIWDIKTIKNSLIRKKSS